MPDKRKSIDCLHHEWKKRKKADLEGADDWIVPSKASFDCTANQVLIIGPPSTFSHAAFSNLSKHLLAGDEALALALTQSLSFTLESC